MRNSLSDQSARELLQNESRVVGGEERRAVLTRQAARVRSTCGSLSISRGDAISAPTVDLPFRPCACLLERARLLACVEPWRGERGSENKHPFPSGERQQAFAERRVCRYRRVAAPPPFRSFGIKCDSVRGVVVHVRVLYLRDFTHRCASAVERVPFCGPFVNTWKRIAMRLKAILFPCSFPFFLMH